MREAELCGIRACVLQRVLQRVGHDDPRDFIVEPQRETVARQGEDLDEDRDRPLAAEMFCEAVEWLEVEHDLCDRVPGACFDLLLEASDLEREVVRSWVDS